MDGYNSHRATTGGDQYGPHIAENRRIIMVLWAKYFQEWTQIQQEWMAQVSAEVAAWDLANAIIAKANKLGIKFNQKGLSN